MKRTVFVIGLVTLSWAAYQPRLSAGNDNTPVDCAHAKSVVVHGTIRCNRPAQLTRA